ncbi:Flp family type IVb pilin [Pigmentiphaga sp. GD03639]|uniref:Flp family type IVb pilin n=1 Tax=unclassified Pigmentiphaga TaxID=2626614 RepID=UPI00244A9B51|nr:Flp family type IVb pilin [Pigmentiphaga sp. GD03639]MDH2234978.1 Flp family type IVb pilin [Pigmentiphaga sp. GD03639]
MNQVMKFLKEDDGATAIEYGLIAGLIAVVIIGVLTNLGTGLKEMFGKVVAQLPTTEGGSDGH